MSKNKYLSFPEIFENEGLYMSSDFRDGVAFRIYKAQFTGVNTLEGIYYSSPNDIMYKKFECKIDKSVVNKTFIRVFNRNQLFHKKSQYF